MHYCAPSKVRNNYYMYEQLKDWYFLIQPYNRISLYVSIIQDKTCKDETDLDILIQKQRNTA